MNFGTSQKYKKLFIFFFLGVLALVALSGVGTLYYSFHKANFPSKNSLPLDKTFGGYTTVAPSTTLLPSEATLVSKDSLVPKTIIDSTIVDRKLMQDGSLVLRVVQVENGVSKLSDIAVKLGGRVDNVSYENIEGADNKIATVVFRVPAANFTEAMLETKNLALSVLSENVTTRDVTEQFVDMQARLKTMKVAEEQYLEIMKKATKVEDILSVSKYLSEVRMQIEQIQGQMNYLSRLVDMSIITVQMSSDPEINPKDVAWSPSTIAKDSMKDFVQAFYAFIELLIRAVLYYVPILVLLGGFSYLLFLFFVKVLRPWYLASKDLFHF